MAATASQLYFRLCLWRLRSVRKVEVYLQT